MYGLTLVLVIRKLTITSFFCKRPKKIDSRTVLASLEQDLVLLESLKVLSWPRKCQLSYFLTVSRFKLEFLFLYLSMTEPVQAGIFVSILEHERARISFRLCAKE